MRAPARHVRTPTGRPQVRSQIVMHMHCPDKAYRSMDHQTSSPACPRRPCGQCARSACGTCTLRESIDAT